MAPNKEAQLKSVNFEGTRLVAETIGKHGGKITLGLVCGGLMASRSNNPELQDVMGMMALAAGSGKAAYWYHQHRRNIKKDFEKCKLVGKVIGNQSQIVLNKVNRFSSEQTKKLRFSLGSFMMRAGRRVMGD